MKQYAVYLRVSTQKQGQTQLGLSSQRSMCEGFIKEHNGELGKEFLDIESGTHRDRKGLWNAIEFCNKNHCPLVIATLSRLARDVEFCFKVINTGIEIHFVDMPTINTLLLGVFASVAQYERELTSDRTKKALAVKKAQGAKLGSANEKYIKTMAMKSEKEKKEMFAKRGARKSAKYKEDRDTQVFKKVLQNVFGMPDDTKVWDLSKITLSGNYKYEILAKMKDFKDIDKDTFKNWDLEHLNNHKLYNQLASKVQAFKKSFAREQKQV